KLGSAEKEETERAKKAAEEARKKAEGAFERRYLKDNDFEYVYSPGSSSYTRRSKYGQYRRGAYQTRGEVMWGLDSHLEMDFAEAPNVLMVLTEFSRSPKLAILLTKIVIFVKNIGAIGRAIAGSEAPWQSAVMRALEDKATLGYYGKGFFRPEFFIEYEGDADDYVSEDIVTSFNFLRFGLRVKHIEYLKLNWRMPPSFEAISVPIIKWCAGSIEFMQGRQYKRLLGSKIVPWNEKFGLHTTATFYWKKPIVLASTISFVLIGLIINGLLLTVNPFLALTLGGFWIIASLFLAEAINAPAVLYHWENEVSLAKALWATISGITKNFIFFNVLIPLYNVKGIKEGVKGRPLYPYTRKELVLKGNSPSNITKLFFVLPMKIAAVLLPITIIAIPATPLLWVVWGLYAFGLFSWIFGPYILNWAKRGKDGMWDQNILKGIKDGMREIYGIPFWVIPTTYIIYLGLGFVLPVLQIWFETVIFPLFVLLPIINSRGKMIDLIKERIKKINEARDKATYPATIGRIGSEEMTPDIHAKALITADGVIEFNYLPATETILSKEEEDILRQAFRNWLATLEGAPPKEIPIFITYNMDQVAEHKSERIEINRALLRAPPEDIAQRAQLGIKETPEERQLFIDGIIWHEGYHLLNLTYSEEEAEEATLKYYISRPDILVATEKCLDDASMNLVYGKRLLRRINDLILKDDKVKKIVLTYLLEDKDYEIKDKD
ncbi:MAG: hypothetical protein KKB22_04165, partial [Candidatus Omnitrophica bacterium]|nr:hypothetical protein [Candidatus Omnitrophota bacterium]